MHVIRNRNIYFFITGLLAVLSIISISVFGFRYSIDFVGGTIIQARYETKPEKSALEKEIRRALPEMLSVSVRESGENEYLIRTPEIQSAEARDALRRALSFSGTSPYEEKRWSSIGPVFGKELATKALLALVLALCGLMVYITIAFANASETVSSWKYGFSAILGLAFAVLIPSGVFASLGNLGVAEIDPLFVTALLVILGYGINDTIVVFDRVRENLKKNREFRTRELFSDIVGKSLFETLARSINTSLTVVIVLLAVFFFGGDSTKMFSLALLVGIVSSVFSSLCFSASFLVALANEDEVSYKHQKR